MKGRVLVVVAALTLTCCGGAQAIRPGATATGTAAPSSPVSTASSESSPTSPPTTSTPTPGTPPPTASPAQFTPQPSPTPLPEETYSFEGTGNGQGTVSYSGSRIYEMTVTASWSFACYVNGPLTDPFDIDLPDGQHLWAYGVGGYGSTHFPLSDSNFEFSVTALPRCNWTLTGTLTPG
jgi:hypothetical protein